MLLPDAVNAWYRENGRDLPWRRVGFPVWGNVVSEFMLQQTPVARVLPKLAEWLERWPTPAALASVPPGEAVRAWDRLGYPRRALNLHATATAIVERHGGEVPSDVDALLALPGVGPYTARAIAVFGFGERHPVVDTNVRRVIARAVDGRASAAGISTVRDLAAMDALLPADDGEAATFNAATMELGAIVCTARSPKCDACPIAAACAWRAAGYPVDSEPGMRRQPSYEGSDRQARGAVLAVLRASELPVPLVDLERAVPDDAKRARAIAGLLADGLATGDADEGFTLP